MKNNYGTMRFILTETLINEHVEVSEERDRSYGILKSVQMICEKTAVDRDNNVSRETFICQSEVTRPEISA